ncbi:unnamed protein product [Adineta steineri]|uniref:Secreted protein n=1 Tax=Adineta steineri TaxID=433720 RepID=A0A814BMG4_9BILA|nr:unnamed protein product [Adineta steineri]CAF1519520.1 unnamed protein product [Adineta steineri]CAF1543031.1 unnamed protein product [Adineta steineri]CAF1649813.1 unnamed protein product [Adineta steineri]
MKAALALIFFTCIAGSNLGLSCFTRTRYYAIKPMVSNAINNLLGNLFGHLPSIFSSFLSKMSKPLTEMDHHLLNHGISTVMSSLVGSRFIEITSQLANVVSVAQGVISTTIANLTSVASKFMLKRHV